jgi:hypothetical protein
MQRAPAPMDRPEAAPGDEATEGGHPKKRRRRRRSVGPSGPAASDSSDAGL